MSSEDRAETACARIERMQRQIADAITDAMRDMPALARLPDVIPDLVLMAIPNSNVATAIDENERAKARRRRETIGIQLVN